MGKLLNAGDPLNEEGFAVRAILEYQSCDDQTCYLPDRVDFEIPLQVWDNVWD